MATTPQQAPGLLSGEMGTLVREMDWASTPIGAPETWSPALRTVVSLVLANRFPQLLWWGPDYISIYNDAYCPILGRKHPWGLGKPVRECWSEIWSVLKPLIDSPVLRRPFHVDRRYRARNPARRIYGRNPFHRRLQPGSGRHGARRDWRRARNGSRNYGESGGHQAYRHSARSRNTRRGSQDGGGSLRGGGCNPRPASERCSFRTALCDRSRWRTGPAGKFLWVSGRHGMRAAGCGSDQERSSGKGAAHGRDAGDGRPVFGAWRSAERTLGRAAAHRRRGSDQVNGRASAFGISRGGNQFAAAAR